MRNLNLNQLTLDFPHLPSLGRDDFMVADCNSEAVKLIDSWPQWPYFAVCIYGPEGCGKTHLANVFANKVANLTHYPYRIPFIKAKQISLTNFRSCLTVIVVWLLKNCRLRLIRKRFSPFTIFIAMRAATFCLPPPKPLPA